MSTLTNMQELVAAAKQPLDGAMRRLETLLPKAGPFCYSLYPSERELKVVVRQFTPKRASCEGTMELSHFSLSFLPGCREVMVLHGVTVDPSLRSQGIGGLLHSVRLDIARAVGARVVLCTVLAGNSAEKAIIRKAGWRVAIEVNPQVEMWSREL